MAQLKCSVCILCLYESCFTSSVSGLLGNGCVLRMIELNHMKFMQYKQLACLLFVLGFLVGIAVPDRMQNTEVPRKHNIRDNHVKEGE